MQKYGLMSYDTDRYRQMNFLNLGDYIQSIAAKQFLPKVDHFIPRDYMNEYSGDKVKMIMNGWYMYNPRNYPPSKDIVPLHTSIHINSDITTQFFNKRTIKYLKDYGPIGCRDLFTQKSMQKNGIESYFSGCLTLTLGKTYKRENITDDIYFIDVMHLTESCTKLLKKPFCLTKKLFNGEIRDIFVRNSLLNKYFSKDIMKKAIFMEQYIPYIEPLEALMLADDYLKKLCRAKLVVTSRIHVALPCLAMGTPVVFINADFKKLSDTCRFDGLLNFFNRIDYDSGKFKTNFPLTGVINLDTDISNKENHVKYAKQLFEQCTSFINT